jgi:hypothetical protein
VSFRQAAIFQVLGDGLLIIQVKLHQAINSGSSAVRRTGGISIGPSFFSSIYSGLVSINSASGRGRQLSDEPRSSQLPVAHDALGRDIQDLCCFFHAQASKKTQFDDARFSCIDAREVVKGLIQRQNLGTLL